MIHLLYVKRRSTSIDVIHKIRLLTHQQIV
nr:MAG TPA: hypothetical protein [Caudoviricetes sp.]